MLTAKRCVAVLIAISILALAAIVGAGEYLSYPFRRVVGESPPNLNATSVLIHTAVGDQVSGWTISGKPGAGVVLLLHGVRSDRRSMVDRARFLSGLGYGVLLIDLPAHGESTGDHITFGLREAEGVKAALSYIAQHQPGEKVGVIGVSLGAASLVLAKPNPAPSAIILESMFPTIDEAVTDRLRRYLGNAGAYLAPLLLEQLPLRFGISLDQLRPIDHVGATNCPVFIIAGATDQSTTLSETERIYAASAQPKQLWVVDGAAHVDLYTFDRQSYERRVADFFERFLRRAIAPVAGDRSFSEVL